MILGSCCLPGREQMAVVKRAGGDCVELFGIPYEQITDGEIEQIVADANELGLKIASIQCGADHLCADLSQREREKAEMIQAMRKAHRFGTDIVMINVNCDRSLPFAEALKQYRVLFSEYAEIAEAENVRIAIENCPHPDFQPHITFGNLALSPETWEALFNEVPSDRIGLEFDPSHLFWQEIDIPKAIRRFADKIFCVHAKDTEINRASRDFCGVFPTQRLGGDKPDFYYRVPGMGDIDWKVLFRTLYSVRFDGSVVIELEDPNFPDEREEEGLTLGTRFLRNFIV